MLYNKIAQEYDPDYSGGVEPCEDVKIDPQSTIDEQTSFSIIYNYVLHKPHSFPTNYSRYFSLGFVDMGFAKSNQVACRIRLVWTPKWAYGISKRGLWGSHRNHEASHTNRSAHVFVRQLST